MADILFFSRPLVMKKIMIYLADVLFFSRPLVMKKRKIGRRKRVEEERPRRPSLLQRHQSESRNPKESTPCLSDQS